MLEGKLKSRLLTDGNFARERAIFLQPRRTKVCFLDSQFMVAPDNRGDNSPRIRYSVTTGFSHACPLFTVSIPTNLLSLVPRHCLKTPLTSPQIPTQESSMVSGDLEARRLLSVGCALKAAFAEGPIKERGSCTLVKHHSPRRLTPNRLIRGASQPLEILRLCCRPVLPSLAPQ